MRTQPDIVAIIIKITLKNKHRHIKKKRKNNSTGLYKSRFFFSVIFVNTAVVNLTWNVRLQNIYIYIVTRPFHHFFQLVFETSKEHRTKSHLPKFTATIMEIFTTEADAVCFTCRPSLRKLERRYRAERFNSSRSK